MHSPLKILSWELQAWMTGTVALLPFSLIGNALRGRLWAYQAKRYGGDSVIFPGAQLIAGGNASLGRGLAINRNVIIDASQGIITIGDHVAIGPNCVLRAADHVFVDPLRLIREQRHAGGRITIGDDCWLGANVVVLRDVSIGRGSVIAAGAVVNRDIPPFSIAAGVPAKTVGTRGESHLNKEG